jgi:hypothetical protein
MKRFIKNLNSISTIGIVNKIRPKVILQNVESIYKSPVEMKLPIPSSEIGSLTTLEASMLISTLKIFKPKVVFEYGTFLGYSTSIFLKNTSKDCKVFSIDLGKDFNCDELNNVDSNKILLNDETNDNYLRIIQSKSGPIYIKKDIDKENKKLELIYGDSTKMSIPSIGLEDKVNFVFVDGGHSYDIIKSDTYNALKMVKKGIIIWHDYNSKIHGDVTKFVDEFAVTKKVFHIENTMLAFHIVD